MDQKTRDKLKYIAIAGHSSLALAQVKQELEANKVVVIEPKDAKEKMTTEELLNIMEQTELNKLKFQKNVITLKPLVKEEYFESKKNFITGKDHTRNRKKRKK